MASVLPLSLSKRLLGRAPPADPPRHLADRLLTGVVRQERGSSEYISWKNKWADWVL